jgi:predicted PurR-regulated permease PerM
MLALNGFISIFVCYYLLVDGKRFSEALKKRVSEKTFCILETSSKRISNVFVGSFYFSIIISLASIPFFIYFDIPFWAIASGIMFLAALIPIFAEWMVIVLLSIYVLLVGGTTPFLIFLITGLVFIYLIPEFVLRPLLVGRYSDTHPLLLLLAFIGGGMAFGISGFFLAPMFVCAGIALWEEW